MNPKMQTMDTPKTRAEFELRFHHLFEALNSGRMNRAGMEGLLKLRPLPNGRLDFLSVDEMTRLQANMMLQFASFTDGLDHDDSEDR